MEWIFSGRLLGYISVKTSMYINSQFKCISMYISAVPDITSTALRQIYTLFLQKIESHYRHEGATQFKQANKVKSSFLFPLAVLFEII
jgi:hypothetical protein